MDAADCARLRLDMVWISARAVSPCVDSVEQAKFKKALSEAELDPAEQMRQQWRERHPANRCYDG